MKKMTLIRIVSGVVWLGIAVGAQAQVPTGTPITLGEIGNLIQLIANFLIGLSLVVAVIAIAWAGISYMAAGEDTTKVGAARQKLVSALIGALIVMGIGVILSTLSGLVTRCFFGWRIGCPIP